MIALTPKQSGSQPPTLLECYENTYARLKLRGAAHNTKRHYYYSLRYFDQHLGRMATIADLTDDEVGAAMGFIVAADGLGLGPRSANKFRDNILALWRFLARKGIVSQWPDVDELVEPERIPTAWSREQLAQLWAGCNSLLGMIGDVPENLWWHALHAVVWDTGERISAAVSILASDVDLERRWLVIRAETRKGKRADKISRLHPDTVALLRSIISPGRDRVFPWPYSPTYLWNRYRRLLKLAGLPDDRFHKFHCIRKSVASYFAAAGGNPTSLLGHSSAKVTAKYIDPRITGEQHAADVLFRPVETAGQAVELAADVVLLDVLDEFQASNCWSGANAVLRRQRAVYRLRAAFEACQMTTAASLAADRIEGYLLSLLTTGAAHKTVREYGQDVCMFVRWLVKAKLSSGPRPELGRIVAMDVVGLIEGHNTPGGGQ